MMTDTQIKLKCIFYRFMLVEVLFALAYSAANYYFFMQHGWLQMDELVSNMAIPLIISIIPVLIWVRPQIRLLDLTMMRRGNPFFGFIMIATLAIGVTTLALQNYLTLALGKLTSLNQISEITQHPATRYYTIKQHYTHPHDFYINYVSRVTGKHNNYLNFYAYVVCPVYDSPADTGKVQHAAPVAWLGKHYSKQISNSARWDVKVQAQRDFQQQIGSWFSPLDLNNFVYLSAVPRGADRRYYTTAIRLYSDMPVTSPLIFQAHKEPFNEHTGNYLWWLVLAFVIGNGIFLGMVLNRPLNAQKVSSLRLGEMGDFNNWKSNSTLK